MYNRFIGGDVEPYNLGPTKFYVLTEDEVNGMKERIRDQGNRIAELEADVCNYQERESDAQEDNAELSSELAQQTAEADLFHAAYVGMCTMHPNRAVFTGHSQQEH